MLFRSHTATAFRDVPSRVTRTARRERATGSFLLRLDTSIVGGGVDDAFDGDNVHGMRRGHACTDSTATSLNADVREGGERARQKQFQLTVDDGYIHMHAPTSDVLAREEGLSAAPAPRVVINWEVVARMGCARLPWPTGRRPMMRRPGSWQSWRAGCTARGVLALLALAVSPRTRHVQPAKLSAIGMARPAEASVT